MLEYRKNFDLKKSDVFTEDSREGDRVFDDMYFLLRIFHSWEEARGKYSGDDASLAKWCSESGFNYWGLRQVDHNYKKALISFGSKVSIPSVMSELSFEKLHAARLLLIKYLIPKACTLRTNGENSVLSFLNLGIDIEVINDSGSDYENLSTVFTASKTNIVSSQSESTTIRIKFEHLLLLKKATKPSLRQVIDSIPIPNEDELLALEGTLLGDPNVVPKPEYDYPLDHELQFICKKGTNITARDGMSVFVVEDVLSSRELFILSPYHLTVETLYLAKVLGQNKEYGALEVFIYTPTFKVQHIGESLTATVLKLITKTGKEDGKDEVFLDYAILRDSKFGLEGILRSGKASPAERQELLDGQTTLKVKVIRVEIDELDCIKYSFATISFGSKS
jgi:hypothetical protein